MRLLAVFFLILAAVRPMPVIAAMPDQAHAMMMSGGEAAHCDEERPASHDQHEGCGECCLSLLPPIHFEKADVQFVASSGHGTIAAVILSGRSSASDPPPPRA